MANTVWGYSPSKEVERWDGFCATREEAIAEARAELGLKDDEPFWIVVGRQPDPSEFIPSTDWILEHMGECAGDNVGEVAEDWPDVDDAAEKELGALLKAWAEKHCPIRFWIADGKPEMIE